MERFQLFLARHQTNPWHPCPQFLVWEVGVDFHQRKVPPKVKAVTESTSYCETLFVVERRIRSIWARNWANSLWPRPFLCASSHVRWDLFALSSSGLNKNHDSFVVLMAIKHDILALAANKHSHLGSLSELPSLKIFFALNISNGIVDVLFSPSLDCLPMVVIVFEGTTLGLLPVPSLVAVVAHVLSSQSWGPVSEGDLRFATEAVDNTSLILGVSGNWSDCLRLDIHIRHQHTNQQAWQNNEYSQANV